MAIRFACPSCRAVINAPEGTEGQKSLCPNCRQAIEVPKPTGQMMVGQSLPAPPPLPPAAPVPAADAPTAPWYRRKWAKVLGSLAGLMMLGSCCTCGIIWKLWPTITATIPITDEYYKRIVLDHLRRTMHDYSSLEIVEWGEPKTTDGTTTITLRARGKNVLGAKVVNQYRFEIRNGKIVSAQDE